MISEFDVDFMDDQQPEENLIKHQIADASHPEPDRRWGEYGNFVVVGHGEVTNPNTCGIHVTTKGCLRVDLHNVTTLNGENFANKVYVRRHPQYCYKSSCPSCSKYGWAVREAGRIEHRTKEAAKHFGVAEHIVMSISPREYHLSFKTMRRKAISGLMNRGVIGGCLIFHGFRYKRHKGWYWSPHFHCIGFILGGYAKCRKCNKKYDCTVKASYECGGFVARSYKEHKKDAFICKVLGARKTVFGTAWYQLNHSSYDKTKKNFHIATWFGVCSYRKLKVTPEVRKELCPICHSELVDIRYTGSNREQFSGTTEVFPDFVENGVVVWVEKRRKRCKVIALARNKINENKDRNFRENFVDDIFPSQFPVCFCCGGVISTIDQLSNVGGRPVHIHCKEKLENGRKEVAC